MRLIDADALADALFEKRRNYPQWVADTIGGMSVVDAVPVVRCKDCKHYKDGFCYNPNTYDDEKTRGNTVPDWFCAGGERRDE